jgi:hypothetical protein
MRKSASLTRGKLSYGFHPITPAMIEAGVDAVLGQIGGYELDGLFSARDLALKVFLAMSGRCPTRLPFHSTPDRVSNKNRRALRRRRGTT